MLCCPFLLMSVDLLILDGHGLHPGHSSIDTGRSLTDVAPTILELLGLPQPQKMTGRCFLLKPRPVPDTNISIKGLTPCLNPILCQTICKH